LQLALTPKGKEVQRAADPIVLEVIEERFSRHISDDEARVMLDALTRTRLESSSI
jgi:DNA-binding MarR family transcriptional regulator